MADHPQLQAQRSDGNVFAFRRLKWGAPPERFRVESILRRRPDARIESLPALLNDEVHGNLFAGEPPKDIRQVVPVTNLNQRRMRERTIDAAAWAAAIVSVLALATAIIWTGLSQ